MAVISMAPGAVESDQQPIPLEQRQALVDRIAASNELRRSARLRAFLLFVWQRSAADPAIVIHEQEIGSAVFGRPEFYDTAVDNIVRVNATELRKRLERYFADEGACEELLLEIQRGSYVPAFRRRVPNPPAASGAPAAPEPAVTEPVSLEVPGEPAELSAPKPVAPAMSTGRVRLWQAACVLLVLCCAGLFWWARSLRAQLDPWKADPALEAFWS